MSSANQSSSDIKKQQEVLLTKQLQYLLNNSPYYKELFSKLKLDIATIKTIEHLTQIPVTTKSQLAERNFDFLCVDKRLIIDYATTSGTTGTPVTIGLTENDLQRLAFNEEQSFVIAGAKRGDVYQLMLTLDRQFMAGMAYFMGLRKLGAGIVRVGPASPQMQWENILRFKPNAIVAVPSFILKLIEFAKHNGIDLAKSGIEKAICIGEPVRNADLTANILAERITNTWDIQLHSTYASTEMQTAFTECEHGTGGHLQPDLIIVEVLDENGKQVPPAEPGEVTITNLGVEGMPLLRFATGDICCYYNEPCACGRNTLRLSPVIGRKNQMIKYRGTTIFPPAIFDALRTVAEVKDYLIEVSKNDIGTDEVLLHVLETDNNDTVIQKIKSSLQSRLKVTPAINFVSDKQLQVLRPAEGRKVPYIIFR